MRIALLTTDNREHHRNYDLPVPYFGPAIEAVLQGLAGISEFEIHVIACTQRPMKAPNKLSQNTWFHLLDVAKIGWLRTGYQGCIRAIRRKLRELQPDIVHGQGTERECALSAVFSGFPNVVTIHGNMSELAKLFDASVGSFLWSAGVLERFALSRADGVLCNSAYTQSLVRPRCHRTWRVPNALRDSFFEPLPATSPPDLKPKLLNIGVIGPRKRQLELLQLAEELHHLGHQFELQFIGAAEPRDPYVATFRRQVEKAELSGFAAYLGEKSLPDLVSLMDSASALVHVPSEEAFGLVVAEALARNLKFFGTHVGGIPDIAGGIEGAELFRLEDEPALATAIGQWLQAGCPRPKTAAREMRLRYHPEVIAKRHSEIYAEVLRNSRFRQSR
jgi:glycosyltransferase involved in cell wall biosynthesis